jgi:L-alanine-DL-glutamate epimerase-like enolase superfamily enzyme
MRGKATGRPVYELLGCAERTEIPMYWSIGKGYADWNVQPVQDLYEEPVLPVDGRIILSDRPGLGLSLREDTLAKWPLSICLDNIMMPFILCHYD